MMEDNWSGPWTEEEYFSYGTPRGHERTLYGDPSHHSAECDQLIYMKMSGVGCQCGVRWYCA